MYCTLNDFLFADHFLEKLSPSFHFCSLLKYWQRLKQLSFLLLRETMTVCKVHLGDPNSPDHDPQHNWHRPRHQLHRHKKPLWSDAWHRDWHQEPCHHRQWRRYQGWLEQLKTQPSILLSFQTEKLIHNLEERGICHSREKWSITFPFSHLTICCVVI